VADLNEIYDAIRKANAQGDMDSVRKLSAYLQTAKPPVKSYDVMSNGELAPSGSSQALAEQSPTSGNGYLQNLGLAFGEGAHHTLQGVGQALGLVSRQDVANSRQLDTDLNSRPGSGVGRFLGTAAILAPTAAIPGANTLGGAATIGAGTGLLAPSASTKETIGNTVGGGIGGPIGLLAGRVLGAGYQAAKAFVQPLFNSGQETIASRALQSFAGGPQASQEAGAALANPPSVLPGVKPTTAELANNAGIAQFERTLKNNPEYVNALTQRNQANRAAMTSALDNIAGSPIKYEQTAGLRNDFSRPLYEQAADVRVEPDAQLLSLLNRPSVKAAWNRASQLASEKGDSLVSSVVDPLQPTNPEKLQLTGKALQYLKMGLNDMISSGPQQGIGSHELGALKGTLSSLNDWIGNNVPALRQADTMYRWASGPLNEMDVGTALRNKLVPALGDFGNNTRLSSASYANALRNGDDLAAAATGMPNATLAGTLRPDQLTTVNQVAEQLARRANADELGRAVGSNTGQNLASQNVLRSFLGPLGLPQSMVERAAQSTFGQSVMRPAQWVLNAGEPKIMDKLALSALEPAEAQRLLTLSGGNQALARALWERQGLMGLVGTTAGSSLASAYLTK